MFLWQVSLYGSKAKDIREAREGQATNEMLDERCSFFGSVRDGEGPKRMAFLSRPLRSKHYTSVK